MGKELNELVKYQLQEIMTRKDKEYPHYFDRILAVEEFIKAREKRGRVYLGVVSFGLLLFALSFLSSSQKKAK